MYNFITNDWKDAPHQLTYDVRQPKTQAYVKEKLKKDGARTIPCQRCAFYHVFPPVYADL